MAITDVDHKNESMRAAIDRVWDGLGKYFATPEAYASIREHLKTHIAELAADPALLAELIVQWTFKVNVEQHSQQFDVLGLLGQLAAEVAQEQEGNNEGEKENLHDGDSNSDNNEGSITTGSYRAGSGDNAD